MQEFLGGLSPQNDQQFCVLNSGLKITAYKSDFDLDVNNLCEKSMLKDNLIMIVERGSKR